MLLLFFSLGLLYLAFKGQDLKKLWVDIKSANYYWVALAMFVSLISHYLRGLRWNLIINPLGYSPSRLSSFFAVMSGYLANLAVPRMGEVSKCAYLNKTDKIPLTQLIGTVVAERVIDFLSLLLILAAAFLFQYDLVLDFFNNKIFNLFDSSQSSINTKFIGISSFLILFLVWIFIWKKFSDKLKSLAFVTKIVNLFIGIKEGLISISRLKQKKLFILYTIGIWAGYFLSTYFCFFAMPETSGLSLFAGLFILGVGGLGMSAPVQGGIGAYHWIVAQGLLVFGIAESKGLGYATIAHSSQQVLIFIFGILSFIYLLTFNKKKNANQ